MAGPLRVLYVFTARKRGLLDGARRGEQPDTLLFGLNHLAAHGVNATFHEPEYGRLGRAVARQAGRLGPDLLQLRTLPRFAAADVVFLTGGWPLLLAARALPRRRRPKLVWLNMTLTNLLRAGNPATPLLRAAVRQADAVVCVARFQQTFLASTLGLPRERLPLVLSGTDAAFYDPRCAGPASDDKPLGGAAPHVLAAGRDAGRDYATLLRAVRDRPFPLLLICSPRNLEGVTVPPTVCVRYDVPPAAFRAAYAGAAAVAIPTHGDGFAGGSDCSGTLVLLDALAMGRPCVISDRASVHDYAVAGTHALTVPPGDARSLAGALTRLLDDRDLAVRLSTAGQARVRDRLTTPHFAARLAEVFHTVAAR